MQARENGYGRAWENVKSNLNPRRGEEGPCQECELQKASREEFEVEGFMAQKGLCDIAEDPCPKKTETCSVNTRLCMKKTFSAVGCGE